MANTININIKNCCCCGGSTTGTERVTGDIWPDPSSNEGPPGGYLEAGEIDDRQCKVAIFLYEWIYWLLDALVNTTPGNWAVNFLNSAAGSILRQYFATVFGAIITGALFSVATAGPDISDIVTGPLSGVFAGIIISYFVEVFRSHNITIPLLQDILDKMPDYRDRIICEMAHATNYSEVYTRLETVLDDEMGMTDGQRAIFFASIPPQLLQLLYWSAEWWPSFETETLPSITETCCGLLEPGYPLLPGSVTRCQASNYVLFQFMLLLQQTGDYVNGYWDSWYDLQLDFEAEAFDDIQANINDIVPRKIRETAYSLTQFERYLAKYVTDGWLSWNPLENYLDTTFSDFVDQLETNAEDIVCGLYTALNASQAATVLTDEIDTFLATTELTEAQQNNFKTALLGIISGEGDFIGLLFTQDSDILGFPTEVECDGCGWVDPGDPSDVVYDFNIDEQGWLLDEDMSAPDGQWYDGETLNYWYSGKTSGAGTAKLGIYYPSLVTVDDITIYAKGTTGKLNHLVVYTSDDLDTWTPVASATNIPIDYDNPHTFEDLGIVDKYVLVYGDMFWDNSYVRFYKFNFHTDGV